MVLVFWSSHLPGVRGWHGTVHDKKERRYGVGEDLWRLCVRACHPDRLCSECVASRKLVFSALVLKRVLCLLYGMSIVKGIVERGKALARQYGFPTANISVEGQFDGEEGTYAATIYVDDDEPHPAAVYCARRRGKMYCEAHLLDGEHELYGKQLTIRLLKCISTVVPFRGELEMRQKISNDIQLVQDYFKTYVYGDHS